MLGRLGGGWVPACAGMTVGAQGGGWGREGVWVLGAARYPRRGAGMTELLRGCGGAFLRGCDGVGVAGVAELFARV